jgi:hypothetical protein
MFRRVSAAIFIAIMMAPASKANALTTASRASDIDSTATHIAQRCYSSKWDKAALIQLAKQNFVIEHADERNSLAKQLLNCLAVPDPKIRDDVAYYGLTRWLRTNELSLATKRLLFAELIENFGKAIPDELGVYQPFIALVMSELARADRKTPYLNDIQREILVTKSVQNMTSITDYRGFDETYGWRHNVAHTADIFLQLSLNPALSKEQLSRILNAIGEQVIPQKVHFYTYGESERLAKPLLYIFLQGQHNEDDWQTWLEHYITPKPYDKWQDVFTSQEGLSKLHNARAFLAAILVLIVDSKNEQLIMLKPNLIKALNSLP